ncbi:unnamed protein product [Amoebophrya sp. A25]|nr:unnamed protein product [Amoebophrya sp. A25]|eukprot:GSA25T00000495001.1
MNMIEQALVGLLAQPSKVGGRLSKGHLEEEDLLTLRKTAAEISTSASSSSYGSTSSFITVPTFLPRYHTKGRNAATTPFSCPGNSPEITDDMASSTLSFISKKSNLKMKHENYRTTSSFASSDNDADDSGVEGLRTDPTRKNTQAVSARTGNVVNDREPAGPEQLKEAQATPSLEAGNIERMNRIVEALKEQFQVLLTQPHSMDNKGDGGGTSSFSGGSGGFSGITGAGGGKGSPFSHTLSMEGIRELKKKGNELVKESETELKDALQKVSKAIKAMDKRIGNLDKQIDRFS